MITEFLYSFFGVYVLLFCISGKHLAEKVKQKGHYYDSVDNCVQLDTQLVRLIFKPFIDKLVDLITEVLREENLLHGRLVTVYAVGGTAEILRPRFA